MKGRGSLHGEEWLNLEAQGNLCFMFEISSLANCTKMALEAASES